MNAAFVMVISIIMGLLLIISSLVVPRTIIDQSLKTAYLEAVQSISEPAADNLYYRVRGLLPNALLNNGSGQQSNGAQSVGQYATLLQNGVLNGQHRGKEGLLHIAMDVLMVMPLRIAAILKFLLVALLFIIGGFIRGMATADAKDYNLVIDTSGDVNPPNEPFAFTVAGISLACILLVIPLPCPIWVPGAIIIGTIIAPWLGAPSKVFPELS